jgi:hypothetical protein
LSLGQQATQSALRQKSTFTPDCDLVLSERHTGFKVCFAVQRHANLTGAVKVDREKMFVLVVPSVSITELDT